MKVLKLSNGVNIPVIGFGTWKILQENNAKEVVLNALKSGYRHIDTAAGYDNEEEVGEAIKESGIPREELFITTKLWNAVSTYKETIEAFETSLKKLQLDYVDLYLIHWPAPLEVRDHYIERNKEVYRAMEELYRQGKIKALGVSNFLVHHLKELEETIQVPIMVNQIEYHPYYNDVDTISYCQENNIIVEAYSPLGRGEILNDIVIKEIAEKHQKSPAQICIKYALKNGIIPLPKTQNKDRMEQNIQVFDFDLSDEEMNQIKKLNKEDGKIGSHPDKAKF